MSDAQPKIGPEWNSPLTPSRSPASASLNGGGRIIALDGVRGLAILLVVLYHYYSRWPEARELFSPWFTKGYLGVQLFFLLSGYLIFRTIEHCPSYLSFLFRRWLRLFPGMLVATGLILMSSLCLYRRVEGIPGLYDALPGLLFIDPDWLRGCLHLPVTGPLEGDFWTLFTEVKFYVLFGGLFFLFRRRAVWGLAAVAALGAASHVWALAGGHPEAAAVGRRMVEIDAAINAPCYGWFAAGAFFYLYSDTKRRRFGVCSATAALAGMLANYRLSDPVNNWGLVAVYSVFVSPFFVPATARWFSSRVWVFSGLISYPLYLLHENAGWAMILAMRGTWPSVPVFLLPLVPLALIGSVAWLTAAFLEPLGREVLAGSRRPVVASFTLPRLGACTAVAIVAAAAAAVGTALPMTRGREALEAQVLAEDRATLLPLEESLARERLALEDVQRARQAAEQALRNLERK